MVAIRILAVVANVKQVQDQIYNCEGFSVEVRDREGRPRPRLADYDFERAARGAFSVEEWKTKRFAVLYPQCDVSVLRGDGVSASNRMTLARVRSGYEG